VSLTVWAISGGLFLSGALLLCLRRQLVAMAAGLELMLNAANVALVYGAGRHGDAEGLAIAFLVVAVAAAEVVVGLSLILALVRRDLPAEGEGLRELAG
jgi:NADH-quinone oxidoreductase subunit K